MPYAPISCLYSVTAVHAQNICLLHGPYTVITSFDLFSTIESISPM